MYKYIMHWLLYSLTENFKKGEKVSLNETCATPLLLTNQSGWPEIFTVFSGNTGTTSIKAERYISSIFSHNINILVLRCRFCSGSPWCAPVTMAHTPQQTRACYSPHDPLKPCYHRFYRQFIISWKMKCRKR